MQVIGVLESRSPYSPPLEEDAEALFPGSSETSALWGTSSWENSGFQSTMHGTSSFHIPRDLISQWY